ncbi:MAG: transporter substrate-binding domain-containing protein [Ruminococcaceae bacterium]|nr:transporter substrate-binding domain-containing protein [Oscillospiraceae bacterium]
MKKTVKILIGLVIITVLLSVSAFAAEPEYFADKLSEIGIFKGTNKGYELDREPTRTEAAVMFVRLLGAEEEAMSLSYTAPFVDVDNWAKPYVQYLYDKNLIKGIDEITFGSSEACYVEQYSAILLRVLGYSDEEDGDFEYDDVLDFAEEEGILDVPYKWQDELYRKDVVTMTYTALASAPKSGETNLLTKLVNDGAIQGAEELLETFSEYRKVETALKEFAEADRISADIDTEFKVPYGEASVTVKYEIAYVCENNRENPDKGRMSVEAVVKVHGIENSELPTESVMKAYYKDGYMYANTDGEKEKISAHFEDMQMIGMMIEAESINLSVLDFAGATKEESVGGVVTYKISDGEAEGKIVFKNGKLFGIEANSDEMEIKVNNIKTDGTVIVRYPGDLHMYEDMTPAPGGTEDFENVSKKGELIIGMTMFEPLNYLDEETEELTGFETDFAREVCSRLNLEPVFLEIEWSDKEYQLQNKEIDCIWNGLTITEERKETMDFSNAYLTDAYVVLVRREDTEKYSKSAKDAKIIDSDWRFFAGDMDYEYFKGNAQISGGESYEDDLAALLKKEYDMIVASAMSISDVLKDEAYSDIVILPEHRFFPEEYGIGFRKESTLKPVIDGVIKEMKEDGTLLEIAKKYNLEEMIVE